MINTCKIKGRMKEKDLSQEDVAKKLGIAQSTFSQKINGIRGLSLDEANKLSEVLEIPQNEFGDYFFAC